MALSLFSHAACIVPETLAARELRVRDQMVVACLEVTATGVAAVGLASAGLGVWAIVGGALAGWVARTFAWWAASSWRPTTRWSLRVAREITGVGLRVASAPLINEGMDALTRGVVGRVLGVSALGLFDLSGRIINLPVRQLTATFLQRVALPAFCIEQEDRARLVSWHLTSVRYVCLVMAPAVVLLVLEADSLVRMVLGPSWLPAVPLIRVLAPAMFLRPLADARPLFVAWGRPDLVLKVSMAGLMVAVPVLLVTAPFGLVAVGAGLISSYAVSAAVNLVLARRLTGISWVELLRPVTFPLPAATAMGAAMLAAELALAPMGVGGTTGWVLRVLVGGLAFAGSVHWQDRGALREIARLARSAAARAPGR
jgi:O-antigen/teichoic acid export membrane protein